MKLRHQLRYDAAPADVVAMMTTPAFWDRVAVATDAFSSSTAVTTTGAEITVVSDTEQPVKGVPSFAKKFAGESARAITTQVWTGTTAAYSVQTPGKPTSLTGSITVAGEGSGAVLTYDLELKASVPLIGGKLEKLMGDLTAEGFEKEGAVGAAWLAGEQG